MKNWTRVLSLLLAALMLASLLVSCGETNDVQETKPQETTPETVPETEDPIRVDPVNLEGYEFRIHFPANKASCSNVLNEKSFLPEQTGDVVDNAIYARNQQIMADFNCKIIANQGTYDNYWEETPVLQNVILSGTEDFDVLFAHLIAGPNLSLEGCFLDLTKIDTLDLSKPWWPQQMVNELTLDGQIYFLSDQIGLGAIKSTKVNWLNLDLFTDMDIPLPYEEVIAGNWTLDKLIALTKDIHVEKGTGNKYDDIYGFVTQPAQNGWLIGCDTPVLRKDDVDLLALNVDSEKLALLVSKIYDWYFESNGVILTSGDNPDTGDIQNDWCAKEFGTGHALVGFGFVQTASTIFREMENLNYGMIPFPKWDEAQENYYSFTGGDLICVSRNAQNLDQLGTVLSALACETYKTVTPAYLNDAMKGKYLNDEESKQVLDIVADSLTISFAYAYDNWEGYGTLLTTLFGTPAKATKDLASYVGRSSKKAQKRLNKIIAFFEEHEH